MDFIKLHTLMDLFLKHSVTAVGGEVGQFRAWARLLLVFLGAPALAQGARALPDINITRRNSNPENRKVRLV